MKFTLALCALALAAPAIARRRTPFRSRPTISIAPRPTCISQCSPSGAHLESSFILRDLPLESTGVRPNRDTLYSEAVFDLDAGPVRITLPKAGNRFMSMMVVNQDHYVYEVDYTPGNYNFTRAEVGTRYVFMALRILIDPANPKDIKEAHALQDAVIVRQKSAGRFEAPNWDPVSQKKVRDSLLALNSTCLT